MKVRGSARARGTARARVGEGEGSRVLYGTTAELRGTID